MEVLLKIVTLQFVYEAQLGSAEYTYVLVHDKLGICQTLSRLAIEDNNDLRRCRNG